MNLELFQIINFNIQYLQSISSAPYLSISLPVFKGYLSSLRGCESGRHAVKTVGKEIGDS